MSMALPSHTYPLAPLACVLVLDGKRLSCKSVEMERFRFISLFALTLFHAPSLFLVPSPHAPSHMRTHAQRHPIPFSFLSFVLSPLFLSRAVREFCTLSFFVILPWMVLDGRMAMASIKSPKGGRILVPVQKQHAHWTGPRWSLSDYYYPYESVVLKKRRILRPCSCKTKRRGPLFFHYLSHDIHHIASIHPPVHMQCWLFNKPAVHPFCSCFLAYLSPLSLCPFIGTPPPSLVRYSLFLFSSASFPLTTPCTASFGI